MGESIPRILAANCGANPVRLVTKLRARHASSPDKNFTWGIDGERGVEVDMNKLGIWEPFSVKSQTLKTATEAAAMLLRVDHVVSGKKSNKQSGPEVLPEQTVGH